MLARYLLLSWLLAACGDNFYERIELVRVDPEPAGINCKNGGVAIETGNDANHNGTLDDNEITSTSYVCNGSAAVQCEGGTIHQGNVSLQTDADFATLTGVNCIDGDLLVTGYAGAQFPNLPNLSIVTGNVVIAANPDATSLDAFHLRKVGSGIVVEANGSLTSVAPLAGLTTFASMSIIANAVLTDLSGFEAFADLHKAALILASNPMLASLHGLENLTSIQVLYIHANANLTSLAALGNLRSAAVFEISANAMLPSLELPALQTVAVRLLVNQNASLATVSLPALTSLSDGLQFLSDGALTQIELPALVLTGSLEIQAAPSLLVVHAPKLTFATVNIIFNTVPKLTDVDLKHLTTIGGQLQISYALLLPNLSGFSGVTSLGGDLTLNYCNALADFTGLGPITTVPGNMTVQSNATLTGFGGLSAMTEVGGNLQIASNPNLPLAVAQAFANGITVLGTATIQ